MADNSKTKQCLFCKQSPDTIPLIQLEYRNEQVWICPQHLPILIHDPSQLIGKLEGAENLAPSDFHD